MSIACESCDGGYLQEKRVHRFTGFVVFLGYILLLASLIGVLVGGIGWIASAHTGPYAGNRGTLTEQERTQQLEWEREREETLREMLAGVQVPEAMIDRVLGEEGLPLSEEDLEGLTLEQRTQVRFVEAALDLRGVSSLIAIGLGRALLLVMFVVSILGGLLGWLFVRKRQVLQCEACGAEPSRR